MEERRWIDGAMVVLYFLAVAGVGLRFSRRQDSTETYFAARRSIPPWALGMSMFATLVSSITFIAYPGSAYAGTWSELYPMFMVLAVLVLVGAVIVPFYRQAVGLSAYEYFGQRFGYGARAYSALAFSAGHFSKMGFVLYLLALTASSMTGWNIYLVLLLTGLVTVLYTLAGGLEAVIWTDVLQGFVMCLGVLVVLGVLVTLMPGGVGAALELAGNRGKFSLGSPRPDFADPDSLWVMTLYGFFWFLQKYCADQTLVQRYLVARSDREALRGVALGAVICLPVWTLFMLIGTLVWAFYTLSGAPFPASVLDPAGQVVPDRVFPHFLVTRLPVGLSGLFLAAVFAAGMSTLSSDLNCLAAVGVEDGYRRWRPHAPDAHRLRAGRGIVGLCGVAAMGVAALIAWKGERVLSLYYAVSSTFSGGLAGLFLLAFLSRRANRQGLWIGLGTSLLFTAWATLTSGRNPMLDLGAANFPWTGVMIGVIAHLLVLGVGYLASLAFPPGDRAEWTLWGWLARRPARAPRIP